MPTEKQMLSLGDFYGKPVFWADETFEKPGLYVWNGERNVRLWSIDASPFDINRPATNAEEIAYDTDGLVRRLFASQVNICREAAREIVRLKEKLLTSEIEP